MNFSKVLLLSILIVFGISCDRYESQHIERPIDPWVFRSVLDKRPRMITLALHNDLYAAFDASRCGLYKIWKGGISIHGAPFDGIKTVQPTSWGHTYALDSLTHQLWILKTGREQKELKPSFKGYQFIDDQVYLQYILINSSDTISIEEKIEFVESQNGKEGLARSFSCSKLPLNTVLQLESMEDLFEFKGSSQTVIQQLFVTPEEVEKPEEEKERMANKGLYWLEKSGCGTCHEQNEKTVGPGYIQIAEKYIQSSEVITQLVHKVKNGGSGVWGEVPMIPHPQFEEKDLRTMITYILSLKPQKERKNSQQSLPATKNEPVQENKVKAGFGAPLEDVHPSYDLSTIRPHSFKPKVAAMDFMSDGSLLVSTWDSLGAVYRLQGVETGDTNQITIKRIAAGLAEPLGLKVVDDNIFVQQKHELTQLIDHDGDEMIDEYKAICNSFGVTADFHEFALGLEYQDGYFYTNLSLAMRLMAHERQLNDRGRTIRISPDGSFEHINFGLRQPNGLGVGIEGELFTTDNQGRWAPANKFIHIQEGVFHGSRLSIRDSLPGDMGKPPAVWLPQDEIGNSPSQPLPINDGPYKGQMIHGEVTHGGIKRVFLEKIEGEYQGCVFRFMQGLEAGINRMVWGPDDALYVGGVGMNGNWGWNGKTFGLQRLKYNGETTFEMLAVRAKPDGLEIEFTEPLGENEGLSVDEYFIQQWWYLPTANYGGPKKDLETLSVKTVRRSADRKKVYLQIPNLKEEYVVYIRLKDDLKNSTSQSLWTSECWYTLNHIPKR